MTAYKVRSAGGKAFGGAALAIFDEAFSKIDGNNAKAALNFFSQIGLQIILAAPPESEIKVGPYVHKAYNVIRSRDVIYLDHKHYKLKARELLQSDDPYTHESVVEEKIKEIAKDLSDD